MIALGDVVAEVDDRLADVLMYGYCRGGPRRDPHHDEVACRRGLGRCGRPGVRPAHLDESLSVSGARELLITTS
jgi:hypothetical protein